MNTIRRNKKNSTHHSATNFKINDFCPFFANSEHLDEILL